MGADQKVNCEVIEILAPSGSLRRPGLLRLPSEIEEFSATIGHWEGRPVYHIPVSLSRLTPFERIIYS